MGTVEDMLTLLTSRDGGMLVLLVLKADIGRIPSGKLPV